jgi:HSP20 family protein
MNLTRWDPFRELDELQTRLNRLTGDAGPKATAFTDWTPAVDVQETETEYVIKGDLPEVKKEDLKVTFHDGVLTLEGERRLEHEERGGKFHRIERAYGKFVRRFSMPSDVDGGKVAATFKDGVLIVKIPKATVAKPAPIQVKVA